MGRGLRARGRPGGRRRERGAGAGDEAQFHPRYVGELLGDMRVRRVIRLSKEPAYRKEALEVGGDGDPEGLGRG